MRKSFAICFVSLLFGILASTALAQEGGVVAVLDVKRVFDEHREFQAEVERVRGLAPEV